MYHDKRLYSVAVLPFVLSMALLCIPGSREEFARCKVESILCEAFRPDVEPGDYAAENGYLCFQDGLDQAEQRQLAEFMDAAVQHRPAPLTVLSGKWEPNRWGWSVRYQIAVLAADGGSAYTRYAASGIRASEGFPYTSDDWSVDELSGFVERDDVFLFGSLEDVLANRFVMIPKRRTGDFLAQQLDSFSQPPELSAVQAEVLAARVAAGRRQRASTLLQELWCGVTVLAEDASGEFDTALLGLVLLDGKECYKISLAHRSSPQAEVWRADPTQGMDAVFAVRTDGSIVYECEMVNGSWGVIYDANTVETHLLDGSDRF